MKRNRKIWGTERRMCVSYRQDVCFCSGQRVLLFAALLSCCLWLIKRRDFMAEHICLCRERLHFTNHRETTQFTSINMPKTSRGLRSLFVLDRKYTPTAMRKRDCEFAFNLNLLSVSMGYVLWWFSRKTPSVVCVNNLKMYGNIMNMKV